ncbi:MAG TPA: M20 family metallopeptidase [Candidatus Acidoferrum sp.]|nr:M20 family metallopeptidase [Candidatus Acidoferrum sp.]
MTATITVPQRLADDVVLIRRDLHMHPELGFREHRTAGIIADRLRTLGYEVHEGIGTTGVVGILKGAKPGRTIMLRADMDALPILEERDHAYRSQAEGTMHACGHDGHVAILLGAAALLADRRDDVAGTVALVFQPAEEGLGGAKAMIDDGIIERFAIERAYGLHLSTKYPTGVLGFREGPMYASSDSIEIEVVGVGGHGSAPQDAIDPIYTAANFITSVQQVVSRKVDPLEPAVVTIGAIHGGTTHNVIPRTCTMLGTVRAFNDDVRAAMPERIERVLRACCDASGATYDYKYLWRYPVTANDIAQTQYARALAVKTVGDRMVVDATALMGAEDFSYFAQRIPSCFYTLGCSGGPQTSHPHHSSLFDIDERALPNGIAMMTALALDATRNAP